MLRGNCDWGSLMLLLHARTHARTDGEPPDTKYLFLGDYSGRGDHEVIAVCLVLALKVSSACG
jgi:hypothetical protein